MFRHGDGVITTTNLGALGDVAPGSFAVVQEAHFLGDYTIQIMPGDRVLKGVRESDLSPATDLPWWAQSSPAPRLAAEQPRGSSEAVLQSSASAGTWLLRLILAAAFGLVFLYGLSAWT